ncbi:ArsR family transcriptional regulator [Arthrobacter sp. MYb23]|uniref:winged helix-turn-helix domain-containing protein n=1 Tax=unclassified Arthrobacter TaxID=235627 RepID=UPI000CFB4CE3|nr:MULTISPECIES: winged helix-turn-helix domain-containing protein [unclassified Arthrobacter]PRB41812.1 ArsR family transcriptional regulator [Arthrobacter sp. MYb51]PRB90136.1 ArsR family transcriptional regulator [Arthrobacter sp. MYb23]
MTDTDLQLELAALEERVAALEAASARSAAQPSAAPPAPETTDPFWVLSALKQRYADTAVVTYAGSIPAGDHQGYKGATPIDWQYGLPVTDILARDWETTGASHALVALGSPARIRFLQEILRGNDSVASLSELEGVGTPGQVYHHLSQLQAAGWVRPMSRGRYGVPGEKVIPLLVIILASGGTS